MNIYNIPEPPVEPQENKRIPVFVCSGCGEDIYEGDDYWNVLG